MFSHLQIFIPLFVFVGERGMITNAVEEHGVQEIDQTAAKLGKFICHPHGTGIQHLPDHEIIFLEDPEVVRQGTGTHFGQIFPDFVEMKGLEDRQDIQDVDEPLSLEEIDYAPKELTFGLETTRVEFHWFPVFLDADLTGLDDFQDQLGQLVVFRNGLVSFQ